MKGKAFTVVIFSYLLLGHPAPVAASLESVLAPVWMGEEKTVSATESRLQVADRGTRERRADGDQPLVEPGFDSLDLLEEIERQVAERLQVPGRLRLIPTTSLPRLPDETEKPEVVIVDYPPRLTSNHMFVRFRLLSGGEVVGNYAMSFKAQAMVDVWVPNRRLNPGEKLSAEDLSVREIDLAREPKAVPVGKIDLNSYEVVRPVVPDQPLEWTDLAPRSLVRKGDLVEVVAQDGMLSITMKGLATRSGALGEFVTVRNLESKREFSAEVIDENRVRVHL